MTYEPLWQILLRCVYCSIQQGLSGYVPDSSAASIWYMSDFWSCFTIVALSVSIPFSFFVCQDRVLDWSCHFRGLPQIAWRNTMEILSVLHLTWTSNGGFRSMFPCGTPEENTFWGPQTGWDTTAVHLFSRTEHLPWLGPVTLLTGRLLQQECQLLPSSPPGRKKRSSRFFPD